jgi:hypothetical protein
MGGEMQRKGTYCRVMQWQGQPGEKKKFNAGDV